MLILQEKWNRSLNTSDSIFDSGILEFAALCTKRTCVMCNSNVNGDTIAGDSYIDSGNGAHSTNKIIIGEWMGPHNMWWGVCKNFESYSRWKSLLFAICCTSASLRCFHLLRDRLGFPVRLGRRISWPQGVQAPGQLRFDYVEVFRLKKFY